jgi:hypothetical protein
MNFRWHPETLNADCPDCGNDHRYQSILRVELASFLVRFHFQAMVNLIREGPSDLIDHAKLGVVRPVRVLQ